MPPNDDIPAGLSLRDDRVVPADIAAALGRASGRSGFGVDVAETLDWVVETLPFDHDPPALRDGWMLLAATAATSVGAARILEPHLDALRILAEAEASGRAIDLAALDVSAASTWGVFAAEGAGMRLRADETADGWRLNGTKPWCSLASHLSHALVTAWVDDDQRRLFAIDLRSPSASARTGPWHARGLPQIVSAPLDLDGAPAVPVGETGWYLRRAGFAHGGIGVAACWWGGATALLHPLRAGAARDGADQLARVHLGRADTALWAARAVLAAAADGIERGDIERGDVDHSAAEHGDVAAPAVLAARVRAAVADAVELTLREAEHALGPLPLVADEAHARRVADLQLYVRQHHGDRDVARIGADIAQGRGAW
ncbi:MAG: acyl-CoA dehydrogenase [Microbacterium arborescens]